MRKYLFIPVLFCLWSCSNTNSDTELLKKMVLFNATLEHSRDDLEKNAMEMLENLKKSVVKNGKSTEGIEKFKRAANLFKSTAEVISYIESIKMKISSDAGEGINPKTRSIVKLTNNIRVHELMIGLGDKKDGFAYPLEKKLDEYIEFLAEEFESELDAIYEKPNLTPDNAENYLYKNNPQEKNKDFATAHFGNTPVIMVLAILTQKGIEVLTYEQKVMMKLMLD
jgi:RNase H-fold protein (predicted Holliday junction resolvase)